MDPVFDHDTLRERAKEPESKRCVLIGCINLGKIICDNCEKKFGKESENVKRQANIWLMTYRRHRVGSLRKDFEKHNNITNDILNFQQSKKKNQSIRKLKEHIYRKWEGTSRAVLDEIIQITIK